MKVKYKNNPRRDILKEEYVRLLDNYKQAILLDKLIRLQSNYLNRKDWNNFILEEQIRFKENKPPKDLKEGWFTLSFAELQKELVLPGTTGTLRRWLKPILQKQYVFKDKNYERQATTSKFRINPVKLKKDLNKLGYNLKNFIFKIGEDQSGYSKSG